MGRTNPTYRDLLRATEERWAAYRRALRRRDQPRFDRLFAYARNHADAAGTLNHQDRLAPVLMSVALEQERRLDESEERVAALEDRAAALEERVDALEERVAEPDPPANAADATDAEDGAHG